MKITSPIFRALAKTYRSDNIIVQKLSSYTSFILLLPVYWIIHGKEQLYRLKTLKETLLKQGRKASWLTVCDAFCWFFFCGYFVFEYITYFFEQKSFKERLSFASEVDLWKFANACADRSETKVLKNKRETYKIFSEWYKRDVLSIESSDDYSKYLEFVTKHPIFFSKPLYGSFGRNSGIVDTSKYSSIEDSFHQIVKYAPLILEELIIQCPEMAQFNPSSINTVRTAVLKTKNGPELLFGFIRNGRKGTVVDNGGSGGIFIPYDCTNGKLCKYGYDENGNIFTEHPDSKIIYHNFQIPRFDEIKELSLKLVERLPKLKYIGFDVAIRPNDIVIVEVNHASQFVEFQALHEIGFKKEIEEIMRTDTVTSSFRAKQKELFS